MKKLLVTGSAGLIGSEAVRFFCAAGFEVIGIDNNMRAYFFGDEASTDWNRQLLEKQFKNYIHIKADIRDENAIDEIFSKFKFDLIIHTAAQPSHDWAAQEPLTDFSVNATGTLILLEAFKKYCPKATFIFTSTNKVYGDTPNFLPLIELETRYEIDPKHKFKRGIDETMQIDGSKHSVFGASKVAADVMVQEYGRYFGLHTAVFRGGCLTGPAHSGTKLHGFLAYLIKCIVEGTPYTIFGYKGKQVRDNIHSSDLISAFYEFYKNPRIGEVYNMGGSRHSNISMMEAIELAEQYLGKKGNIRYTDENRSGDHIWYISDVTKFQKHFPKWKYEYDINAIVGEICEMGHFSKPIISVGEKNISGVDLNIREDPKVFVASHVTEAFGPVQALKFYLIKNFSKFIFIEHPFIYTNIAESSVESYRGSLLSQKHSQKKINFTLALYVKDFVLTSYWFLKLGRKCKYFIGIDGLNASVGGIFKKLGFKFDLIYYSVDYSQKRFSNTFLNTIYKVMDKFSAKNATFVWNTSLRMREVRKNQGISENKNLLVPNGIYVDVVPDLKSNKIDKNTLVVVEHLTDNKGIRLILDSISSLKKINPRTKLLIIGSGPNEAKYKKIVKKKRLSKVVSFKDSLNPRVYLDDIAKCGIGLCMHLGNKDSFIYYSDPTTVKEMLSVGLPVVVSNSLWISDDVENKNLGISIEPNKKEIITAIKRLWEKDIFYDKCSQNAVKYTKNLLWYTIFDSAFPENVEEVMNGKNKKMKELKDLNIGVATHEYFKGSGQELRDFLVDEKISVLYYVAHMFAYIKNHVSYLKVFEKGVQKKEIISPKLPSNEYLMYIRDAFYNIYFFLFTKKKFDFFIGIDSFNAIFGLILKKLGKVDKVVFMTIDYIMHNRSKFGLLNWIYVKMDRVAFFGSDYTWNVSDRMSRQREKELGEKARQKTQLVVPIGVPINETEKIKATKGANIIVYSGSLTPESGIDIAVEAMPKLIEKLPNIELRIIGLGPLADQLKARVKELGIEKNVNFVGYIDTNVERERWLRLLKESTVGLAPYPKSDTGYKQFSDVTKPKDYMACRLPIITTSIIPLSEEIEKFNLGRVVEDTPDSLSQGVIELLENVVELKAIEENVYKYSKDTTWDSIFKRVFSEMGVQF